MKKTPPPENAKAHAPSFARRDFIKSGMGGAGAVAVSATIMTSKKSAAKGGGNDNVPGAQKPRFPPSPIRTPFKDPLFVLQPIQWVDVAGEVDGDKATHTGMVRIGNEALDRWYMEPVIASAEQIARTILRLHLQPEPLKLPRGVLGI